MLTMFLTNKEGLVDCFDQLSRTILVFAKILAIINDGKFRVLIQVQYFTVLWQRQYYTVELRMLARLAND